MNDTFAQLLPWLTGGGFVSMVGAVAYLWIQFRKVRREDVVAADGSEYLRANAAIEQMKSVMIASIQASREESKTAIDFVRKRQIERAAEHKRDLDDARQRAAELAEENRKDIEALNRHLESNDREIGALKAENEACRRESARQDEHSKEQDDEIRKLRHKLASVENNFVLNKSVTEKIEAMKGEAK